MTVISERTFIRCSKLTLNNLHLTWADLTSIEANAFEGCSELKGEVNIYCEVAQNAFDNCPLTVNIGY